MATDNEDPNPEISPEGLKNSFYKKLINAYRRGGVFARALIIIFIILFGFCSIRLGYLGEGLEKLSKRIVPVNIPVLDPAATFTIPMSLSFDVVDSMGRQQQGRLGGAYQSGDQLILHLHGAVGYTFFYTLVGVDSKGVNTYRKNVKISPVDGQNSLHALTLDNTLGYEVYYVIGAKEKFEVAGPVARELDAVHQKLSKLSSDSKGALAEDYSMSLNEAIYTYDFIHIKHIE